MPRAASPQRSSTSGLRMWQDPICAKAWTSIRTIRNSGPHLSSGQFDKTAAVHDRSVGPHPELAVNGNSKGEAVSAGHAASGGLAFEVAGYFQISTTRAREIAADVAAVVSTWRAQANRRGLSRQEIDRMASAFEHRDLEIARGR